jgi:4-amino-4-deoxy-L-arabinose transferase-like glycosyltransferase
MTMPSRRLGLVSGLATAPRATPREDGAADSGERRRTHVLYGILALAFALRLAWVIYAARDPVGLNDPSSYLSMGNDLAHGNGYRFPYESVPTAYFPIGYPLFVAAIAWVVGHTPLSDVPMTVAVVQALLGTASVWLVWRIVRRVFDERTALVAAGLMAVFPGLLLYSAPLLSETLFVFFELCAIAVLVDHPWAERAPSARRLVAFGVLTALAAMVRSQALLFLLVLPVAMLLARVGWRRALRGFAVALAAAAVTIAPLTIRNAVTMNAFIPISTNTGDDLCIGHNLGATGAFALYKDCVEIKSFAGGAAEVARDKRNTHTALKFAWEHPRREVELAWKRAYYTYDGDYEALDAVESFGHGKFIPHGFRTVLQRIADGWFWLVMGLGLVGAVLLWSRRDGRRLFLLGALLAMALTPLVFFGDVRFHVPASALFVIAAAVAITSLARRRVPATT